MFFRIGLSHICIWLRRYIHLSFFIYREGLKEMRWCCFHTIPIIYGTDLSFSLPLGFSLSRGDVLTSLAFVGFVELICPKMTLRVVEAGQPCPFILDMCRIYNEYSQVGGGYPTWSLIQTLVTRGSSRPDSSPIQIQNKCGNWGYLSHVCFNFCWLET